LFEVVVLSHAIVCYKLEPEINYWTDMFQLYIKALPRVWNPRLHQQIFFTSPAFF